LQERIINFLDIFYPPFRRIMPLRTFRYAVCGGANTVLGLVIYYICLNFIFNRENVDLSFLVLKPHNAALFVSFCFSFIIGFLLNKYLVFVESNLRGRIQLFRYLVSFLLNLAINYFLLRLFIEAMHIDAFLAQLITTVIVVSFSYLSQHHFSFKTRNQ